MWNLPRSQSEEHLLKVSLGLQSRNHWMIAKGGCVRKAWRPLSSWPILIHFNFWGKPSLIIAIIFCMYPPHSPNKLIATKYCFLIVGDDTSFVFFITYFSFLCSVVLHDYFDLFRLLLIYKNYIIIIIIILFSNNFLCSGMIHFQGCISTPDKDKVEELHQVGNSHLC